ncbi:MAG: hypothetical protein IPF54_09680 [Draconibacterium sp.]|nr:hypothetical protein [Draconibacterium sp.]
MIAGQVIKDVYAMKIYHYANGHENGSMIPQQC